MKCNINEIEKGVSGKTLAYVLTTHNNYTKYTYSKV